jgi:hypothetical protein
MKYDWNQEGIYQSGGKKWSPQEVSYCVFGSSNYDEFSSIRFVENLLRFLVAVSNCSCVSCYFEDSLGKGNVSVPIDALSKFMSTQDSAWNWGVWVYSSKEITIRTTDIVELLEFVEPNDFLLYVDLDGGLLASCPSRFLSTAG